MFQCCLPVDANTDDKLPGKELVDQELRLPSPFSVGVIISIVPISRFHDVPIDLVEVVEIIIEIR